jgi:hypothetical protein
MTAQDGNPAMRLNYDLRRCAERLRHLHATLAAQRAAFDDQDPVPDGHGGLIPAFLRNELLGMHGAVNLERMDIGKEPVGMGLIETAEQQAGGHSDYASKFPFYCAELVYDVSPFSPREDQ